MEIEGTLLWAEGNLREPQLNIVEEWDRLLTPMICPEHKQPMNQVIIPNSEVEVKEYAYTDENGTARGTFRH